MKNKDYLKEKFHEAEYSGEPRPYNTYTFEMLQALRDMAVADVFPDGTFGDLDCSVWSLFYSLAEQAKGKGNEKETDPVAESEPDNYGKFLSAFLNKHSRDNDRVFYGEEYDGDEDFYTNTHVCEDGASLTAIISRERREVVMKDVVNGEKITQNIIVTVTKIVVYTTDDAKVRVFYEN